MLRAMGAPGSSVAVAVLLASGLLQLVNADTGSNSTQPYSCDALARVPLAERCSFVKEHCPSEGLIPYSEWYHCHVAKHNGFICFWYLALVACLLPLFFCALGDTAEFYFSPIMSLVSQSIPKMRPRFAGVTFVALGNGAPDLSANITAIRSGDVLLSAGALTGGAMFVQCIVAAELVAMGGGAKCGGAMMRDVGVYSISIFSVLIAFTIGRVTQVFVGWAITVYVLYVIWVFCGDEWHERGRPQPNVGEWQQTLRSIRDGMSFRRRTGAGLVDEMEESLLPWASAEEGNGAVGAAQQHSGDSLGQAELFTTQLPADSQARQDEDGWRANGHAAAGRDTQKQSMQSQQHHRQDHALGPRKLSRRSSSGGLGAHPYVDARTYKKLVWADLSNDAEEEARLQEEAAQAAEELQRRSLSGASAGPSAPSGFYEPPRPMHSYEELPALSERSGASGASPSHSISPGRGWRGHASPSPFAAEAGAGEGDGWRSRVGQRGAGGVDAWPPDWRALWLQLRHELTLGNSEEWDEAGGVIRTFRQVAFPLLLPLYLALRTTIPFADPGTYSRPWLATSMLCCPLAMVAYFGAASVAAVLIAMGAGLAGAAIVWVLSRSDPEHVPLMECGTGVALGPGLLSLVGFVMGVMWIDTIAGEVVGVLSFLAGLLNFPTGILGLTLLAWGNSLGDFFSNRAMARNGQASTAITACFAAPLFNMLMSLSLGFSSLFHKSHVRSIAVTLTPEVLLGCLFLMAYNAAIVIVGRCCGGRLPAWFAVFARCWYGLYAVLACLSGVLQHYGYQ